MARPRAIQPGSEVERLLLEALKVGAPIRIACGAAGIHQSTYFDECNRNPEFAERAMRIRMGAAIRNLTILQEAGHLDWRAAAKALELQFPEDFARQRIEHSGPDGGPIQVEPVRERLIGELDRLAERRRKALGPVEANGQGG